MIMSLSLLAPRKGRVVAAPRATEGSWEVGRRLSQGTALEEAFLLLLSPCSVGVFIQ